ncbi:MAG: MarR family transcriptional regulator [Acidobacteria bacterium]|nr:MAG: MarR family transcriptional regulator [Acidobacteriota bacterium]
MRSYKQFCGLAKALEIIGDRWTLLIVRELLARGRSRYTDLQDGLPGIATNLLADRLRELEEAGIIQREDAPPPIATSLFRLTPRGEELEAVIFALGRWGVPLLASASKSDTFRSHWLAFPAKLYLKDHTPDRPPISIEVCMDDHPFVIETSGGAVRTRIGSAEKPDAILTGSPLVVAGLIGGNMTLAAARRAGLHYEGDPNALRRLQPLAFAS